MKKLLILALTACLLVSCLCAAGAEGTRAFVDSTGRTVELPETFERIAVSGPLAQIVVFALAPDMLVGIATDWSAEAEQYLPTEYYSLPVLGQLYGTKGALWSEGDDDLTLHIRYLDPDYPLDPIKANPNTPGADGSFGNTETLHFKEESFHVPDSQIDRIWDSLYASIRENKPYPVPLSQALQVMQVIDEVKKHSVFCPKK